MLAVRVFAGSLTISFGLTYTVEITPFMRRRSCRLLFQKV